MHTQRRNFLRGSAAAAFSLVLPRGLRAQEANKKLQVACVGVGGQGGGDMERVMQGAKVIGICDVDSTRLDKAATKATDAEKFRDFREMIDKLGDKLDGVVISTPDHAHFPAAMHAISRGKHVMVQKPLVNTLWEADQLRQAAAKKGVTTNMGNQGHTGNGIRRLREWIKMGAIGKVREVHVWTNRPIWPQGVGKYPEAACPETLDWRLWQAAVPDAPYIEGVHPFKWRGHLEYGAGAMGDMGCHIMDGPFWACNLTAPSRMVAEVQGMTKESWPTGGKVVCDFEKEGIVFNWYEGKDADGDPYLPLAALEPFIKDKKTMPWRVKDKTEWIPVDARRFRVNPAIGGFLIIGESGAFMNFGDYCDNPFIIGQEAHEKWMAAHGKIEVEQSLAPGNPQLEWVRAIEKGVKPGSNFDYSVPLTELCLLGNLAMRCGGTTVWDAAKRTTGNADHDKFIKRPAYRDGYEYTAEKM